MQIEYEGKPGPKRRYEPWMAQKLIEVAMQPDTFQAAMMVAIGITSRDTFNRWRREYPEFGEAYELADLIIQARLESIAVRGALGQIPGHNATSLALLLNNKYRFEYARNATAGGDINNTTINVIQMSPDELRYKIAQKQELLRQRGQMIEYITPDVEDAELTDDE